MGHGHGITLRTNTPRTDTPPNRHAPRHVPHPTRRPLGPAIARLAAAALPSTPADDRWWCSREPMTLRRLITPELAERLLDQADMVNRHVVQSKIAELSAAMTSGNFSPVEQQTDAIAFDVDGRCINGQHRLWAVVDSGVAITFDIKIGLPPEAIQTIDNHLRRSDADVYAITHDGGATAKHMAVAVRIARPTGTGGLRTKMDRAGKFQALTDHRTAIDLALSIMPNTSPIKGLTAASLIAVIARATHTVPLDKLQRFVAVLESGLTEGPQDAPIIMLRDWMMKNGAASGPLQTELYWKAQRALRAWIDCEPIATLYAASGELFLLPGESDRLGDDEKRKRRERERKRKAAKAKAKK